MLINPLRKLSLHPDIFLYPYLKKGMTVIDAGCAMGFFSIPAARLVGSDGTVLCVDLQDRMLKTLEKRAAKNGVAKQIKTRKCSAESLMINDFTGKADVSIAFGVVHEVPDEKIFFNEISQALKPGGILIMGEPRMPVPEKMFRENIGKAWDAGLTLMSFEKKSSYRIAVLKKK